MLDTIPLCFLLETLYNISIERESWVYFALKTTLLPLKKQAKKPQQIIELKYITSRFYSYIYT